MSVSPTQILIIAIVILLLFGGSRLADIGKGLGEGIKNFKKGLSDEPPPEPPKAASPQLDQRESDGVEAKRDDGSERSDKKA